MFERSKEQKARVKAMDEREGANVQMWNGRVQAVGT